MADHALKDAPATSEHSATAAEPVSSGPKRVAASNGATLNETTSGRANETAASRLRANDKCRMRLAGSGLWHGKLAECSPLACSLLQALHDRHIGITPWLADRLAAALDPKQHEPTPRDVDDPWQIATDRLRQALRVREAGDRSAHGQGGRAVIVSAAPTYFVFRVAAFLLDRACRRIGQSVLFCEDRLLFRGVSRVRYATYECELTDALLHVVRDENGELELFWYEAAATLAGRSRNLGGGSRVESPLPQASPLASAFLKRLRPAVRDCDPDRKKVRRVELSRPLRTLRKHRRTDGVNGVTITRSIEDLSDVMLSEHTLPPILRMQRLMNEGFLARFRPPKQEQNRDVLLAVLIPGEIRDSIPGDFLKACWFDLCARLGQRLCQSGLLQSEFRLIEGDRLGMYRTEAFPLAALSSPELVEGDEPSEFYRHDFLNSLQWLPRFLDQQTSWAEPVPQRGAGSLPAADGLADWCIAAWRSQIELPAQILETSKAGVSSRNGRSRGGRSGRNGKPKRNSRGRSQRRSGALAYADFKFVHVMVACPQALRGNVPGLTQKSLRKRVLRGAPPTTNLSVTWLPDELKTDDWWFDTGRDQAEAIVASHGKSSGTGFTTFSHSGDLHAHHDDDSSHHHGADHVSEFAGGLVETWFRQVQQEIWQG